MSAPESAGRPPGPPGPSAGPAPAPAPAPAPLGPGPTPGPVAPSGSVASLSGVRNPSGARVWVKQAMWHETCTHADWVVALLNWVDSARDLFYLNDATPDLQHVMTGSQVLRAHRLRLLSGRVQNGTEIAVTSWLSRVGTKSYDVSHEVYRVSDRKLLAQCTSTAVVVLNGKAVPMPHADRLRHLVIPTETPLTIKVDEPRPVKAWAHRTVVRTSDADSLGHINNAKYVYFVEDAKDAAALAGALPPSARWSIVNEAADARETTELYIDYAREVKPYEALDIHVWPSAATADGVGYDFVRGDTVVTRIRTAARPLARL